VGDRLRTWVVSMDSRHDNEILKWRKANGPELLL
jgi:hypothetical protein